jgi:hypothetical protein
MPPQLVASGIGSHVIASADRQLFDPLKDFTHIALLGGPPIAFVVNAAAVPRRRQLHRPGGRRQQADQLGLAGARHARPPDRRTCRAQTSMNTQPSSSTTVR